MHLESARDLTTHFSRRCSALDVSTFESLCDSVVLEHFRNSVPENIAVYISEHKNKNVTEAAVLADKYVLTHKRTFGEPYSSGDGAAAGDACFSGCPVKPFMSESRNGCGLLCFKS